MNEGPVCVRLKAVDFPVFFLALVFPRLTPMNTPDDIFKDLKKLYEEGDYHELALWVSEFAGEFKYKLGNILRSLKSKSGEIVEEDPEDDATEALALIWQWFAAEDEEGIKKYKKFWKQVFGVTNDLRQLRNRLTGSKLGKFKEILQAQYPSGGMHKNEGLRLHRMCREAMSADQETFRKEKLNRCDYYGLASWSELFEKGFLKEEETIKKLHSYYFKHSNVVDGGKKTSPWTEGQVREACLLALDYVEKYSMVKQLKEAMVKEGWFELINSVAIDYIAVFGQNNEGEGNEDQNAEPYDDSYKKTGAPGALNSGKPSDQFLGASKEDTFQEFKL